MAAAEWARVQSQPENEALVAALSLAVRTFEPGVVVLQGFRSIPLAGHTPGHVGYEITSGTAKLLDVGDVVHSLIVSLAHPEWENGYDNNSSQGRPAREAELAKLAASHEQIFAHHFPFPGVGTIMQAGAAYTRKSAGAPERANATP